MFPHVWSAQKLSVCSYLSVHFIISYLHIMLTLFDLVYLSYFESPIPLLSTCNNILSYFLLMSSRTNCSSFRYSCIFESIAHILYHILFIIHLSFSLIIVCVIYYYCLYLSYILFMFLSVCLYLSMHFVVECLYMMLKAHIAQTHVSSTLFSLIETTVSNKLTHWQNSK